MISSYDPNFHGVHVIRVTFMQWDYIGHVAFEIAGTGVKHDEENAGGANPCAVAYGRGRVFQH